MSSNKSVIKKSDFKNVVDVKLKTAKIPSEVDKNTTVTQSVTAEKRQFQRL